MSFNIDKVGSPICVIKGGKYNKTKIYISDEIPNKDNELKKTFNALKIDDGLFQQIPNTKKERQCGLIVGASGSGKSHYVKNYCKEYKNTYKDRDIYMFSNLTYDDTLKDIKIKRVKIDNSLITEPIPIMEFSNSLVIFDDVDAMQKHLKIAVYDILKEMLNQGRHFNIEIIITSHMANGSELKAILNECHYFVYFPWGATRTTHYVLENYIGIDKIDMKKIKSTKSRWACVYKNFPQCVLTEKNIFMLSTDI
jgi:energy-coupling factor transporter ATP-binding protein EcfA2